LRSLVSLKLFLRAALSFNAVLLAIEFIDELVFGAREAAWPRVRSDLGLSYTEIGLLLGIPNIVSAIVEPAFGIFGDTRHRRFVMVVGGGCFAAALALFAVSNSFVLAMVSFIVLYPASGAFVSLAQATLMDGSEGRHEHAMARWTFAGSLGVVAGPLALSALFFLGGGWRGLFVVLAIASGVLTLVLARGHGAGHPGHETRASTSPRESLRNAVRALRRPEVWRWLVLLEFANFMLDTLLGFLALYLVDERGFSSATAGLAVATWAGVGLVGDGAIILILRRVRGLTWVRLSSLVLVALFVPFLLFEPLAITFALLALLGFFNCGSYAVLKAQLYAALPGQSGVVLTVSAGFGLIGALIPTLLGVIADAYGVTATMWILLAGPIVLAVAIPRGMTDAPIETAAD
jgi:MFS transporter, FSR family, fosmidomycin resistance protein